MNTENTKPSSVGTLTIDLDVKTDALASAVALMERLVALSAEFKLNMAPVSETPHRQLPEGAGDAPSLTVSISEFTLICGRSETRFEVDRLPSGSRFAATPLLKVLVPMELTPTEKQTLSALLLGAARRIRLG